MISKEVVEQYLRANGVTAAAPDDEIKEVLFSAKWHHDDVETALMVLREDGATHQTRVDSLHKVFHSDERLQPETISSLLGIEIEFKKPEERAKNSLALVRPFVSVFVVALILSCTFVVAAMWYLKIGVF